MRRRRQMTQRVTFHAAKFIHALARPLCDTYAYMYDVLKAKSKVKKVAGNMCWQINFPFFPDYLSISN